jgi:hypothetical protein
MSVNYARPMGKDRNDVPFFPTHIPTSTLGSVTRENASASSVTTLTDLTSVVEVTAVTTAAGIRWAVNQATSVITAAGTANFDNIIPANTTRTFIVPRRTQAVPSISGINSQEGLFGNIATISTGVGSVLLAQY